MTPAFASWHDFIAMGGYAFTSGWRWQGRWCLFVA